MCLNALTYHCDCTKYIRFTGSQPGFDFINVLCVVFTICTTVLLLFYLLFYDHIEQADTGIKMEIYQNIASNSNNFVYSCNKYLTMVARTRMWVGHGGTPIQKRLETPAL